MDHARLIRRFYEAFAAHDAEAMAACYHPEVVFRDPAFGELRGAEAADMWRMLIARAGGELVVTYAAVEADAERGRARWEASYGFGPQRRPVHNRIAAEFAFRDGLIVHHVDRFDFHAWARQALGLPGLLFGWTPWLRQKVRTQARQGLARWRAGG